MVCGICHCLHIESHPDIMCMELKLTAANEASPIKRAQRSFTNLCPEMSSRNSPNELKPVIVDHNIQALAIA